MGVVQSIGHSKFPKQGPRLNKRVLVCFNYDLANTIRGVVVRNDVEEPYRTIIRLDDGRFVLDTECQYTL